MRYFITLVNARCLNGIAGQTGHGCIIDDIIYLVSDCSGCVGRVYSHKTSISNVYLASYSVACKRCSRVTIVYNDLAQVVSRCPRTNRGELTKYWSTLSPQSIILVDAVICPVMMTVNIVTHYLWHCQSGHCANTKRLARNSYCLFLDLRIVCLAPGLGPVTDFCRMLSPQVDMVIVWQCENLCLICRILHRSLGLNVGHF